jgi:hypothetical protein
MNSTEQAQFIESTAQLAEEMQLDDALRESKGMISIFNQPEQSPDGPLRQAISHAKHLLNDPTAKARICEAVKACAEDIREIAKVLSAALLPLALAGTIALPITPLAFAALAFVVARAGVHAICADPAK